jgi:ATP-dependent protease HslVU (ClpYQ) peptidase subunit
LTTTVFRKRNDKAQMASDSRVTWVDKESNLPIKWFDSIDYLKTIAIDNVLYGFAGANAMFKAFLIHYKTKESSMFLLDSLVVIAKEKRFQFSIIRYDADYLRLFSHSPVSDKFPEIYRISSDPPINRNHYAIGSGSQSKMYKRFKIKECSKLPIRKIINANIEGLRKKGMLNVDKIVSVRRLTDEESQGAYYACAKKGGDIFTGGEIRVCKESNDMQIAEQIDIMNKMDAQAKAAGAVCASPFNASLEVKQLEKMGQYAVSQHQVEMSGERKALLDQIGKTLQNSI